MTKEKFEAYQTIQKSGITNMRAVDYVCDLSKAYAPDSQLTEEDCLDIMKNYGKYEEDYANKD